MITGRFESEFVFPNVLVNQLAESLEEKRLTISLCGYSACGKSKTARRLRKALDSSALLPLSSFALPREERLNAGLTGCDPRAFDLADFEKSLQQIHRSEDLELRKYDHKSGRLGEDFFTVPANHRVLIIEDSIGITPEIQQFADLTLCFFPEELDNWRKFSLMRDVEQRGYSEDEAGRLNEHNQRDIEELLEINHSDVDVWIQTRHSFQNGTGMILYRALEFPAMKIKAFQR